MKTKFYWSIPACGTKKTIALLAVASLLTVAPAGRAASPSELLEHGIYAEETKGDLDAAMKLYQQAVNEAKGAQAVAAQAQLRLGVCHYKKGDSAEAMAALEQVVKDYPEQKEFVAQAGDYLFRALPLLPAPWEDGEQLQSDIRSAAGVKRGSIMATVTAGETNGQKTWRLDGYVFVDPVKETLIRFEVDAATLRPLRHSLKIKWGREINTVYLPGLAEINVTGEAEAKYVPLPGAVYDDEEIGLLTRCLPLATNYALSLSCAKLDVSSGTRSLSPVNLRVIGTEKLTVPAGTYDCFKVEDGTNLISWFSTDTHHNFVKWKYEDSGVYAELVSVTRYHPGEPVQYRDPVFGFSLTAPPGWGFDRYSGNDAAAGVKALANTPSFSDDQAKILGAARNNPKSEAVVYLLDPGLNYYCEVNVGRLEKLDENARKSPRAWAESDITGIIRAGKSLADLKVRTDSWQELTLTGNSAVIAIGDYGEGAAKQTVYGAWIFDGTNTVKFYFVVDATDFETMRPILEKIVRSYTHSQ